MIQSIVLIVGSLLIIFFDLKFKKVFNIFVYPLICVSILLNYISYSNIGILNSLIGFITGIVVCSIPYNLKGCDYGEFKLMALIGVLGGYKFVAVSCIISCYLLIVIYILQLIVCGKFRNFILNSSTYFRLLIQYDIDFSVIIEDNLDTIYIPFSIIQFFSVILVMIF